MCKPRKTTTKPPKGSTTSSWQVPKYGERMRERGNPRDEGEKGEEATGKEWAKGRERRE